MAPKAKDKKKGPAEDQPDVVTKDRPNILDTLFPPWNDADIAADKVDAKSTGLLVSSRCPSPTPILSPLPSSLKSPSQYSSVVADSSGLKLISLARSSNLPDALICASGVTRGVSLSPCYHPRSFAVTLAK